MNKRIRNIKPLQCALADEGLGVAKGLCDHHAVQAKFLL